MRASVFFVIFLTLFFSISKHIEISEAQVMSGDRFNLQSESRNPAEESDINPDKNNKLTEQDEFYDIYLGQNYKIENGFGRLVSGLPFNFSLSSDLIEFGTLTPNNPVTRTNTLSILSASTVGYLVFAYENHQPQSSDNSIIPDATCDNGVCTQTESASWKETTTYGFGYRCDNKVGSDCSGGFLDPRFFKQFPDSSKQEEWQQVMRGLPEDKEKTSQITYKVNISNSQKPVKYVNILTYIAVPNF